jgi:hypothetical protein
VYTVLDQIGWLETKAMQEGWRSQLTISLDLDNPTLLDIDLLFPKVKRGLAVKNDHSLCLFIRLMLSFSQRPLHNQDTFIIQKTFYGLFIHNAKRGMYAKRGLNTGMKTHLFFFFFSCVVVKQVPFVL